MLYKMVLKEGWRLNINIKEMPFAEGEAEISHVLELFIFIRQK